MAQRSGIPRYKQTKTDFRPEISTGESQVWGDLSQRLSEWQNRAADVGATAAKQRGAAAGAAEGAKPGVPDVEEDPWSIEQKARRDAALMAHKARIQSDVRDKVAQLEAEHPLDPEGFNAALQGYQEGLVSEVHPAIRSDVELLFNDYGGRADARINIGVADQAYKDDIASILSEATALHDEALRFARDGDEDGLIKSEAKMSSMLSQAIKSRLVSPSEAEARIKGLADQAAQEAMIGEFERTLYREGIPAAEERYLAFRDADTTKLGLDPKEKDVIQARMRGSINAEYSRINRGATLEKSKIKSVEKMIADEVKDTIYLMDHGRLNDTSRKSLDRLLNLAKGTKYEDDLKEAVDSYQAVDAFNRLGIREQEAFLDERRAAGQNTGDDARILDRLTRVHEERLTRLKDGEGLDMYYQDGYGTPPDALDFRDEGALRAGLQTRNEAAQQAAQIYQFRVSPLRPAEVSALGEYFDVAPAPDQLRLLGIMQDELGSNYLSAMEQIDKHGGTGLAMVGGLYNMSGPSAARIALIGQEARKAKVVPALEGVSKASLNRDLDEALLAIPNARHRGATKELIQSLYDGLTVSDKDTTGVYSKDRMDKAIKLGMGGSYKWEGSKWGAPESYITPPVIGWTEDETADWLEEGMTVDDIKKMGDPAGFTPEAFLEGFRKYGVLVPIGMTSNPGRPAKTRYSVQFNGLPVKNTDGSLFILEYPDP